jgi:translation elongation factor EF-G
MPRLREIVTTKSRIGVVLSPNKHNRFYGSVEPLSDDILQQITQLENSQNFLKDFVR